MTLSKFDGFRLRRTKEVRDAIDMITSMKHTIPYHNYVRLLEELEIELRELADGDVIQFRHVELLAKTAGTYRK